VRDPLEFVLATLQAEGRIDRGALDAAARASAEKGIGTAEALVLSGVVTARELAVIHAETCEVPFVDLSQFDLDLEHSTLLPRAVAESLGVFPLFVFEGGATVGMTDPMDLRAVDQVRSLLRREVDAVLCEPAALRRLIDRAYAMVGDTAGRETTSSDAEGALTTGREPIVAAVNQILAQAADLGASDIHINPDEHELHLRFRIDGVLQGQQGPGLAAHEPMIRRLKVMANLDLTQTRRPQDGKFRFVHDGVAVDVRLSILPTVCGENAVLRLLTGVGAIRDFAALGMRPGDTEAIEQELASPHGMILVTGPTGSGKTTTVYTALKKLNHAERNVMTIEDPVEIRMPLLRQVQVNAEIGMTFAGALRTILRQDPDVVFVGEIRDEETARIAVQAALTGHLVLSTLHTNDAAGAIPRLTDFRCPAFAINAALLSVIAQRLVRRVCDSCARPTPVEARAARLFGLDPGEGGFVRGVGCARCGNSGYRGRAGVYEVLRTHPDIQEAVESGADAARIRRVAAELGMHTMWRDGVEKARVGLTTLDEVMRVVPSQAMGDEDGPLAAVGPAAEVRRSA